MLTFEPSIPFRFFQILYCLADPIFEPEGFNQTFAEMDKQVKNTISHRWAVLRIHTTSPWSNIVWSNTVMYRTTSQCATLILIWLGLIFLIFFLNKIVWYRFCRSQQNYVRLKFFIWIEHPHYNLHVAMHARMFSGNLEINIALRQDVVAYFLNMHIEPLRYHIQYVGIWYMFYC